MCRLLDVSTNGFYDWLDRPMRQRERENTQLLQGIKQSHGASDGTYGSPRVVRDLIDAGFACSENRVARLMKVAGIKARHKRRRPPGQLEVAVHSIAPNLLDRQFEATEPNQKWTVDFTYVWTGEGWLFVAVVLDLYSRRVVGWQPDLLANSHLNQGASRNRLDNPVQFAGLLGGGEMKNGPKGPFYQCFWRREGDSNIDAAANFESYTLKGVSLSSGDIAARQVQVAVPRVTTDAQWQQIQRAIQYGQSKNVQVVVTPTR
jgi:putative transposase